MATVIGPFCSFRAKGKFGGIIQCQPKPYTKGPAQRQNPVQFSYDIENEGGNKNKVTDFFFPISGWISEKCEMERIMKMVPVEGGVPPEWARDRMNFEEWAKLQNIAFKEARALFNTLNEQQKTSWKIFSYQFAKQDLCTLAVVPVTYFEVFMSLGIFSILVGIPIKLFAPVMTEELSVEAAARGWRATYWYYQMKKASLRRAWVLYRKHKYDIKTVMKITEVWKKYRKWHDIQFEIMKAADEVWKYW